MLFTEQKVNDAFWTYSAPQSATRVPLDVCVYQLCRGTPCGLPRHTRDHRQPAFIGQCVLCKLLLINDNLSNQLLSHHGLPSMRDFKNYISKWARNSAGELLTAGCQWRPQFNSQHRRITCIACDEHLFMVVMVGNAEMEQVLGEEYTVGGAAGMWDIPSLSNINYSMWALWNTFFVGDSLLFRYQDGEHSVLEVMFKDYESCRNARPIAMYEGGNTRVLLDKLRVKGPVMEWVSLKKLSHPNSSTSGCGFDG
ncbi:hypothetical protein GOP47_0018866 [Adiantum capillus-veneris]|uniref:Phytocyanin domain-containing protein n=1 Tax=Adiantum capillus-veneris TaxID=13818 RepID=A0A9D4UEI4_ADICA|nr:hypothetical protein GOP47_0018866 [Adiantum capillus-veneris]